MRFRGGKQMNKQRAKGFLWIFLIYLLATATGIGVYLALPLPFAISLLIADILATVIVFLFSVILKNASVYDPYWSVQPIVIVVYCAIANKLTVGSLLLLIVVLLWGIRLTANWAYTFHGLAFQDWRYTMLKEKTGKFYPIINFVGIHLVPTLVVYACILPAVYVFVEAPTYHFGIAIFAALSLLATILQGAADIQMHSFRKKKTGGFIRKGLWKYSRHPNYLGEILMWWGVGLGSIFLLPQKWYLIFGAVLNTLLFLCVSIPMADKHQARKPGFQEYKEKTRMLLPIYKW